MANIATIAGFFGLVIGYITWLNNQRNLYQSVITSCSNRYQQLAVALSSADVPFPPSTASSYVELCNEELFYMANRYLPEVVIFEWLEGMLTCVGLRHGGNYIHYRSASVAEPPALAAAIWDLLAQHSYPRIQAAFTLTDAEKIQVEAKVGELQQTAMLALVFKKVQQHEASSPYAPLLSHGRGKWWKALHWHQ